MNRKSRFLLAMCAFIFVSFCCPHASADDCTLGTAWDVNVAFPYEGYFSVRVELCFYENGTVFACDPWNKWFYGFGGIFPNISCEGNRTTVYNTWVWSPEGILPPSCHPPGDT